MSDVFLYQLCHYGDTDFIIQTSTNQKPALLSASNALIRQLVAKD